MSLGMEYDVRFTDLQMNIRIHMVTLFQNSPAK